MPRLYDDHYVQQTTSFLILYGVDLEKYSCAAYILFLFVTPDIEAKVANQHFVQIDISIMHVDSKTQNVWILWYHMWDVHQKPI